MNKKDSIDLRNIMQIIVGEFVKSKRIQDPDGTSMAIFNCEKSIFQASSIVDRLLGDAPILTRADRVVLASLPKGLLEQGLNVEANSQLDNALADLRSLALRVAD